MGAAAHLLVGQAVSPNSHERRDGSVHTLLDQHLKIVGVHLYNRVKHCIHNSLLNVIAGSINTYINKCL